MNTGDMEKYCPKPHPVYFNAFSMWQQLSGSVQYLIKYSISNNNYNDNDDNNNNNNNNNNYSNDDNNNKNFFVIYLWVMTPF